MPTEFDLDVFYTAEAKVWLSGVLTTLYFSSREFSSLGTDTPAHISFEPRLLQPILAQRDAFDQLKTSGSSRVSVGQLVLGNKDGGLDATILAGAVDGQSLIVRRCTVGAAYPAAAKIVFNGTMRVAQADGENVTVSVRDAKDRFGVPFQTNMYLGSNVAPNGLEGTPADLRGKRKPVIIGRVENYTIPCVNAPKLIYQANDGALTSVDGVYDRAVPLTYGGAYATLADLLDDAQQPAPGTYKVYLAGGYIRLGFPPAGTVTADLTEGANAAARTAASMFQRVLQRFGLIAGQWSATDITTLQAASDDICGVAFGPDGADVTYAQVLDQIAGSVWAWWIPDSLGVIRVQQLLPPSGAPVVSWVQDDCLGGEPTLLIGNDPGDGLPSYQTVIRHRKNYTVQETDFIAPSLTMRIRTLSVTPTTVTVRVAIADPFPQGPNSVTIAYQDQGSGGVGPVSPQSVTPEATITEAAGTYKDFVITFAAFGTLGARVTFTATAPNRYAVSDAVDVPQAGAAKAVIYAPVAPVASALDDLWVDTSADPNVWHRWDGASWVKITPTFAAEIQYAGGVSVQSLKPAEAGAEATTGKPLSILSGRTADKISYTAGGTVDSLKPAEAGAEQTAGKPLDVLADGATYARTKASELASGQVKQTRDTVESTTLTTNQARREAIMYGVVL